MIGKLSIAAVTFLFALRRCLDLRSANGVGEGSKIARLAERVYDILRTHNNIPNTQLNVQMYLFPSSERPGLNSP